MDFYGYLMNCLLIHVHARRSLRRKVRKHFLLHGIHVRIQSNMYSYPYIHIEISTTYEFKNGTVYYHLLNVNHTPTISSVLFNKNIYPQCIHLVRI